MSLLLTTTRAFWCADPETETAFRIDEDNAAYYGISFDSERIYVAARRSSYTGGKLKPEKQAGVILVFNYELDQIDRLIPAFPLRDVHQVYFFDEALWVVCTWNDLIAIYREGDWECWYPLGNPGDNCAGSYHFNSIFAAAERIYIGGSVDRIGFLWEFDRRSREHLNTRALGYGSHNLWCEGEVVHTLSSLTGAAVGTDGSVSVISRGNFVRGVVAGTESAWFGVSTRAKRGQREFSDAMIVNLPMAPDGMRRWLNFSGSGMVHEIRAPGLIDRAHAASRGQAIDPNRLRGRFGETRLGGVPVLSEQAFLPWLAGRTVQQLDRYLRQRRLAQRGINPG